MEELADRIEITDLPEQLQALDSPFLQRLLQTSMILSSTLDLKPLLETVIQIAPYLTKTENATVLLLDRVSGELYIAAATGMNPVVRHDVVPLESSICGEIIRTGLPIVIDNLEQDQQGYVDIDLLAGNTPRNVLGVPMITKGRVTGSLVVSNKRDGNPYSRRDVTLLKMLGVQAAVAIENARLFQQTDLIAELMHELKTPLMALTAASELLGREDIESRRGELIKMIQRETTRLSKMAQDFLDLARLESGRAQLKREIVAIDELIKDVVRLQEAQAAARDITLTVEINVHSPTVLGDADRLKQVLLNLVSNAIKYNVNYGRVFVYVIEDNNEIAIKISDTGAGIAPENLPHLFERFYRIPDSEGFTKGTGLGLSIAARILQEHGGRLEVDSVLGQGSTFSCYLPAQNL